MGYNYGTKIVTDGLVLCLDAGNKRSYPGSGTTWTDLSGLGNNGTLVNGTLYDVEKLGVLVFDGVNNYVTTPVVLEAPTNSNLQTISGWLIGNGALFGSNADSSGKFHLRVSLNNSSLTFRPSYYGGTSNDNEVTVTVTPKSFNNIVIVKTAAEKYDVYFNAVKVMSQITREATISTNFYPGLYYIGSGFPNSYNAGTVSNYLIYNRALTEAEVQQNYNAIKDRSALALRDDPYYDNVILYLKADSLPIVDSSKNIKSLTPVGDTTIVDNAISFDGNGDYIALNNNAAYSLGTSDFTIDFWAYIPQAPRPATIPDRIIMEFAGSNILRSLVIRATEGNGNARLVVSTWGANSTGYTEARIEADFNNCFFFNQWVHIAVARANGYISVFVNGYAHTRIAAGSYDFNSPNLSIGYGPSGTYFKQKLDDIRITKGVARYSTLNPNSQVFIPPARSTT